MTFDNSNKSTDYDNKGLVQEYIYRTRDSWRAAFVCATEKLDNGDQGWSVFTIDGHVVSSAMAMIEPQSLSDPSQQRTTVLCLSGAQQLLFDYDGALALLTQKSTKEEIADLREVMCAAGYERVLPR